ncbi:tyrosine recombinase XerD [Clostridium coskatii]|uniref:Tyrosine recombinase XerC n=2 Tax=Clostridium coskatii TaxID=1705578 RepID=A0A162NFV8_9CLOT|nr:Tyrosine recombinase XerC [Clostridium coskatii]OBR90792.1 tyrosine recombinase XerD [Clostridium coskatii]
MSKQRNPNGMGTFKQRKDGRYEWRQKIDGQERYISAKTMKELREKIKKITDLPIIKNKYKVDDWFQRWLEIYIKPLKKKATYDQYRIIYNTHIKTVLGNRKLSTIKTYDIQSVIAKMNEKKLSTWTMKHARKIMNIAFSKAFEEKIIAENPVKSIEIPIKQAKPRKTLTIEELQKLFKAMENSRWLWSVKFALVTGLRRGELLALKWSDIDWQNKRISINKSNSVTGLGDTKSSKIHYVPLSENAIQFLNEQKDMLKKEFNPILYNEDLKGKALIFPSESGKMIRPDSYYTLIRRFSVKAGIKASPHCFRHTFVYLTRGNLSLKDLQNILGHSESTTTLDIYGNMLNDNTKKNIEQIDNVFNTVDKEMDKIKEEKIKNTGKIIPFRRAK